MYFYTDQIVAHAYGDYLLQSDYMASEKSKNSLVALEHAFTYSIPFVLLSQSLSALAFILVTHFFIDRFRLARYLVWAKNFLAPRRFWFPWKDCMATGYSDTRAPFMTVWLYIIADNLMHITCNAFALEYLHMWSL